MRDVAQDQERLHALALHGTLDAAAAALDAANGDDARARGIVARVAQATTADVLAPLIARAAPASREAIACLIQERLLRDGGLPDEPIVGDFLAQASRDGHPFAWLPRVRLAEEESLPDYFARYQGSGYGAAAPGSTSTETPYDPAAGAIPGITDRTDDDFSARALGPVHAWLTASNGTARAGQYALSRPVSRPDPGLVTALGFEGLAAPTVRPATLATVLAPLFTACANGGAYTRGAGNARGRVSAWQAIAALAGVRADAPFDDVLAQARAATWFTIDTDSDWFHHIVWDLAVGCLRPGGWELAVVVATDVD